MLSYTILSSLLFSSIAFAAGTPPPNSRHWGLECGHPATVAQCKQFLVECDGRHADWKPQAITSCVQHCECSETGGTPPPAYGSEHPPQIPPVRPVSPLSLSDKSKSKGKGKGKREEVFMA